MQAVERFEPALLRIAALIAQATLMAQAALARKGPFGQFAAELSAVSRERDRFKTEAELLRARLERLDPDRRPRYTPFERLKILWHRIRFDLSVAETARAFIVMTRTIRRWRRDARRAAPRLVESERPVNTLPELVREVAHRLKLEQITWGTRRIAGMLVRLGLKVSRTSIQRIMRESPRTPKRPAVAAKPQGRPLVARYPGHLWQIDFTKIEVFCLFTLHIVAVIDLCSRKIVGIQLWRRVPKARWVLPMLRRAVRRFGKPVHLVSDRGTQFTALVFKRFLKRRGIRHRYGAVRSSLSIAVLERFWRTLKSERGGFLWPFLPISTLRRRARSYVKWYNGYRPHQGLRGATPNEVFYRRRRITGGRKTGVLRVRYVDGDRTLPIYRLDRAA